MTLRWTHALDIALRNAVLSFLQFLREGTDPIRQDTLTGAWSLREFRERRQRCDEYCLMIVDVDHFKAVNDECGHLAGDEVLRHIVQVVRSVTDSVFRIGGEEFVILLACPESEAIAVGRAIVERVAASSVLGRRVTVSVGEARRRPGWSHDRVFEEADRAMYQAKRSGRCRLVAS